MLNKDQLKALLADLESDTSERTESTTNTDKFGQAICAFANDLPNHRLPGYLLVGVKDDGSLAGIQVTDDLLKNLAGIRSNGNILPQPMMSVTKFSLPGGDVAVEGEKGARLELPRGVCRQVPLWPLLSVAAGFLPELIDGIA